MPPPNGSPTGPPGSPVVPFTPPGGVDNNNPSKPPALPDTGKGGVDNPGPPLLNLLEITILKCLESLMLLFQQTR